VVNGQPGAANTRRAFLGGSAAGAAIVLGACGSHAHQSTALHPAPPPLADADITIFNQLLDREYKAIAAYTAGIPLLDATAHDAAKQFFEQELYHASKLYSMIKNAGGEPIKQKSNYQLGQPRSHEDVLRLLHTVERAEVDAYLAAVPVITHPTARAVLAAILANDAQHLVVLGSELGVEPLTGAFVVTKPAR
jgi:bacterioferritin (cytochrome b1)